MCKYLDNITEEFQLMRNVSYYSVIIVPMSIFSLQIPHHDDTGILKKSFDPVLYIII